MTSSHSLQERLPVTRTLNPIYALSSLIAVLLAVVSIAGLAFHDLIYETDELYQSFAPNDVVNILIGIPILLASMWLAWRGKLVGLLLWPGALFYALYNCLIYLLALPLNAALLAHLALVALSLYGLVGLMSGLDMKAIQERLHGAVPERLAGGVVAGLGFLFLLQALAAIVSALARQIPMPETELALHISDFMVSPAWVIGGLALWRRSAFGYATGLGLLFQASMLFIGLIVVLLLQPVLLGLPLPFIDVIVVCIMGLICFIPLALFARGVKRADKISPA